jgi:hypothetical protein
MKSKITSTLTATARGATAGQMQTLSGHFAHLSYLVA